MKPESQPLLDNDDSVSDSDESDDDDDYDEDEARIEKTRTTIPITTLHNRAMAFSDPAQKMLLPNEGIRAKILSYVKRVDRHRMSHLEYLIYVKHGEHEWTINRRHRDFVHLHRQLFLFYSYLLLPIHTRAYNLCQKSFKGKTIVEPPKVPYIPEIIRGKSREEKTKKALNKFLKKLTKMEGYRNYYETLLFLEISPLSFVDGLGTKRKEGFVNRRSGGYSKWDNCLLAFCWLCSNWRRVWLVVKDNCVAYMNPHDGRLTSVILMDRTFSVESGKKATGHTGGVFITNHSRKLIVTCNNDEEASEWKRDILFALGTTARDFSDINQHESFAPIRNFTNCRWIVDGATYFEAVASALEKAQEEIFITGWWLTPEFYMKRPTIHGHHWQLDHILKRRAIHGVKIFIIVYREVELALGLNSAYTQTKLSNLHKNIKVFRHPSGGVFFWAHHEKIVCIDQSYTFIGGLDICYGRWDDYQHRLTDMGDVEEKIKVLRHMSTLPSISYEGTTKETTSTPNLAQSIADNGALSPSKSYTKVPKEEVPVKLRNMSISRAAGEQKLIQEPKVPRNLKTATNKLMAFSRWNQSVGDLADADVVTSQNVDLKNLPTAADIHRTIQQLALVRLGIERKFRLWHGKDYVNFITRDITELNEPYSDNIDRSVTPRMPWHDVAVFLEGAVARDVGRHFIQRWNYIKMKNFKNDHSYPLLIPKGYTNLDTLRPLLTSEIGTLYIADCQIIRSVSNWSAGVDETEHSILNAYIETIRQAKHFIYIENQFFVTQPSYSRSVHNGIADALYEKILEADSQKRPFHVYVVMPLLPAFEGEVGTGTGTVIQAVTHWNYKSICRGDKSLIGRLSVKVKDPFEYVSFCGLRTHSVMNNKFATELIYVHSKLLIVDDRYAIIGSSNINDRSMLGRRDSEIAVWVRDTVHVDSIMDGKSYKAGSFCGRLRKSIFREFLFAFKGPFLDVQDPLSEHFRKRIWRHTAANNAAIYDQVFRCIPTDNVQSFDELKIYRNVTPLCDSDPDLASKLLQGVRGYLVLMPLNFLCKENLAPTVADKEHYLPTALWT